VGLPWTISPAQSSHPLISDTKAIELKIGSAEKHGGDERVKFFREKLTYEHLSSCPRLMLLYYSVFLTLPVKSSELFSFRWFQMVL